MIILDIKEHEITNNAQLLGGAMSIYTEDITKYINTKEIVKDNLGRWILVILESNRKRLMIITSYRMPITSLKGNSTSIVQYIRSEGKLKSTINYRQEILKLLTNHIQKFKVINDIILFRDFNQDIN